MTKRMLIDSSHAEQTRVVIMDNDTLLEFDSELSNQRSLKGNIYLAKITRVEPSLQAAFVDYGGNRHGFLPFSEIHPDYYRIPVADREALLADQARSRRSSEFDDDEDDDDSAEDRDDDAVETLNADGESGDGSDGGDNGSEDDQPDAGNGRSSTALDASNGESVAFADDDASEDDGDDGERESDDANSSDAEDSDGDSQASDAKPRQRRNGRGRSGGGNGRGRRGDDRSDQGRRSSRPRRSYTIQEVIKRGQIMLVQVVKEERGTKGAAVTSYLSLAGRYCVLMPNTARGGGISRKITAGNDRKRLKTIVDSLDIPGGMAVIVRTAGIGRTKTDIKRDFDYLAKTWEQIREVTLQSRAPALIYEESQLIKRVLRDSYSREIEEVLVQGDAAYREAKDFMKTLMPSHAKRVQPYKDSSPPLFHRFRVDAQLEQLHSPIVQLRSGGYLVINSTEALVAIDINSGKATRERHIEETAYKTNMEAAEEIARQLRLRDLAGLIVIDFIDMEDRRNNSAVERRLKDAMRDDRARVQIGRISPLGLLELSRQRLRTSLLETMMQPCPHCNGIGRIHSTATSALYTLRALEDHGLRGHAGVARVTTAPDVAFYILNDKRSELVRFERDYNLYCRFEPDPTLVSPAMRIEMLERTDAPAVTIAPLPPPLPLDDDDASDDEQDDRLDDRAHSRGNGRGAEKSDDGARGNNGQRRRGGRNADADDEADSGDDADRRRRGRRGGRRRRRDGEESPEVEATGPIAPASNGHAADTADQADTSEDDGNNRNRRRRRRRRTRPESKSLPGVAIFAKSAMPLAFHVAPEPTAGESEPSKAQTPAEKPAEAEAQPAETADVKPPKPATPRRRSRRGRQGADRSNADQPAADRTDQTGEALEEASTSAETVANGAAEHLPASATGSDIEVPKAANSDVPAPANDTDASDSAAAATAAESPDDRASSKHPEPVAAEPEASPPPTQDKVIEAAPAPANDGEAAKPEEPAAAAAAPPPDPNRPRRRGWWQRLLE